MLIKSTAIQRLLRENPMLKDRRFGLPYVGARLDKEEFNPTVKDIADAIDFYGYEVRDENIVDKPDINLGGGNPMKYKAFPPAIDEMIKSDLAVNGQVTIELNVVENIIQEENTTVTLTYNEENLLNETGQETLHYLYEYYITK